MDPELKTLLMALAEGQVKLDERVGIMANALAELGRRMDGYAQAVVKGFTAGAERNGKVERRLSAAETRLDRLEKRGPPPRKRG